MDRCHYKAATGKVLFYQVTDQTLAFRVEIGRRFVKEPQGDRHESETRKSHTALLAGRKRAYRAIAPGIRPDAVECLVLFIARHRSPYANPIA
jgi:hypothetical protein